MNPEFRLNKTNMYNLAQKYSGYSLPPKNSEDIVFTKKGDWAQLIFTEPDDFNIVKVTCDAFHGEMHFTVNTMGFADREKHLILPEEDLVEIIPDEEAREAFIHTGKSWDDLTRKSIEKAFPRR